MTGLPYSFTAHAHDIYVERPMLDRKIRDAAFVVTISGYNVRLLERLRIHRDRGGGIAAHQRPVADPVGERVGALVVALGRVGEQRRRTAELAVRRHRHQLVHELVALGVEALQAEVGGAVAGHGEGHRQGDRRVVPRPVLAVCHLHRRRDQAHEAWVIGRHEHPVAGRAQALGGAAVDAVAGGAVVVVAVVVEADGERLAAVERGEGGVER